jgi:hypothetical protein
VRDGDGKTKAPAAGPILTDDRSQFDAVMLYLPTYLPYFSRLCDGRGSRQCFRVHSRQRRRHPRRAAVEEHPGFAYPSSSIATPARPSSTSCFPSACSWCLRGSPDSFRLRIAHALQAALANPNYRVPLRLSLDLPGIAARAELCPAFVADFYLHSSFYLNSAQWPISLCALVLFPRSFRCFLAGIAFDWHLPPPRLLPFLRFGSSSAPWLCLASLLPSFPTYSPLASPRLRFPSLVSFRFATPASIISHPF